MVSSALLSSLLVISLSGILTQNADSLPFNLVVKDNQDNSNKMMYNAYTPMQGVLFGAMMRLNSTNSNFTFTSSQNIDYGEYLESVNGLYGNNKNQTYWELLVQTANKTIIRPNVGRDQLLHSSSQSDGYPEFYQMVVDSDHLYGSTDQPIPC
ncbi:hypothetical protein N1851_019152 [Merluccius polli]|uniref:Uncharacterized protein n=1 Tax=Merluccius polli TaxID=89951 RepID=A0AA47MM43_MERPO|nr:hypothetical protein N1851_019152 [Merluccius polli]